MNVNILTDLQERLSRLAAWGELDVEASVLPSSARRLSDASVAEVLAEVAGIVNGAERVQAVLAGVAASRSGRERGQGGFAAGRGFASPESLIQSITGGTKADAVRQVRVGRALLETSDSEPGGADADSGVPDVGGSDPAVGVPGAEGGVPGVHAVTWQEPLRCALLNGSLTTAQHDAIRRGLGEPPLSTATLRRSAVSLARDADPAAGDADLLARDADEVRRAWSLAAEGLVAEAGSMSAEELAKRARTVRDVLDPIGAEERFAHRFANRGIRSWVDADGQHRSTVAWDDEMGLFLHAALQSALRPRRGGPRFMTEEERAVAVALVDDPRTNDQLAYDLFADLLRAGVLANAKDVFGARQPGVRMVIVGEGGARDPWGRLLAVGHAEDGGCALPGSVIDRNACSNGTRKVTVDPQGNPLDLGREARLYSPAQRIALAVRDGGCVWPGCDRPPSYCEAHHCDHVADGGATDIDRGVLLCRFHHMRLNNHGGRITRAGTGPFVLHAAAGDEKPIVLTSKAAWKWAWDPPPPPERAGWRHAPDPVRSADANQQ